MIYLILWLCMDAAQDDCQVIQATPMPKHLSVIEQREECERRKSATDWMLSAGRSYTCELPTNAVATN